MKVPDAHHPIWEISFVVSVFSVFLWRLQANATNFDSTEIAVITESGIFAVSAVSALLWFRKGKR
jgi:hypothetical protein